MIANIVHIQKVAAFAFGRLIRTSEQYKRRNGRIHDSATNKYLTSFQAVEYTPSVFSVIVESTEVVVGIFQIADYDWTRGHSTSKATLKFCTEGLRNGGAVLATVEQREQRT